MQSRVIINECYRDILSRIGLLDTSATKDAGGDVVKTQRGKRDILRIAADDSGKPIVLYLKRQWVAYRKDAVKSLLRYGEVRSISRVEWENSLRLQQAGIETAEMVACGEECSATTEHYSFLITREADGNRTLDDFMDQCACCSTRRRVIDGLAAIVRQMHGAGLAAPDLFARHIFLDTCPSRVRFQFIDMARLDVRPRISPRLRARDLAALNASLPLHMVSGRERIRFLRAYDKRKSRTLVPAVRRRMVHLLKRSKFRNFE